ncbi:MAG: hypothetical protein ACIAQU_04160 [Phycisphaerales bacterium JB064]
MNHTYIEMWLSKYALTGGVEKVEARDAGDGFWFRRDNWCSFRLGRDIHHTFAEAKADAEKRRQKKIASLRKQIEKLEGLKFEEPT